MAQPNGLPVIGYSRCRWTAWLRAELLWRWRYDVVVAAVGRCCGLYRLSGKADRGVSPYVYFSRIASGLLERFPSPPAPLP